VWIELSNFMMNMSCNIAGEELMEKTLSLVRFNEPPFQALHCLAENNPVVLDDKTNCQRPVASDSSDHFRKRRERNVVSSRLYRKRKRQRMESLEIENERLQEYITQFENELAELRRTFQLFVQHAESCPHCANAAMFFT
jgi:hypothetical protein